MEIKGYQIISLEAKKIYEQELINGVEKGYVLPSKNNHAYFGLFKNVLDYSLDLIELEKCYQKKYRNNRFSFEDEYNNKYTLTIINLKFTYTYMDEKNAILKPILADIFNECRSSYGVKRYTYAVKVRNLPFPVGCNRIRKLMRALGLRVILSKNFVFVPKIRCTN